MATGVAFIRHGEFLGHFEPPLVSTDRLSLRRHPLYPPTRHSTKTAQTPSRKLLKTQHFRRLHAYAYAPIVYTHAQDHCDCNRTTGVPICDTHESHVLGVASCTPYVGLDYTHSTRHTSAHQLHSHDWVDRPVGRGVQWWLSTGLGRQKQSSWPFCVTLMLVHS